MTDKIFHKLNKQNNDYFITNMIYFSPICKIPDDFVIKVYCYIKFLINKYKKICDETQKQILEALSYSDSPTNKSKLKNAVKTLEDANLIQTENFFDERGKRRIEYKLRVAPKATIKTNVMAAAVPKGFKF